MLGIENNNSWEERCLDQLVIFVLDTSGSMSGYRMLDLNTTMEGIILEDAYLLYKRVAVELEQKYLATI